MSQFLAGRFYKNSDRKKKLLSIKKKLPRKCRIYCPVFKNKNFECIQISLRQNAEPKILRGQHHFHRDSRTALDIIFFDDKKVYKVIRDGIGLSTKYKFS